jgi:hypothetical protein
MELWSMGAIYEMHSAGEPFFKHYRKLKEAVYKDKKDLALVHCNSSIHYLLPLFGREKTRDLSRSPLRLSIRNALRIMEISRCEQKKSL